MSRLGQLLKQRMKWWVCSSLPWVLKFSTTSSGPYTPKPSKDPGDTEWHPTGEFPNRGSKESKEQRLPDKALPNTKAEARKKG